MKNQTLSGTDWVRELVQSRRGALSNKRVQLEAANDPRLPDVLAELRRCDLVLLRMVGKAAGPSWRELLAVELLAESVELLRPIAGDAGQLRDITEAADCLRGELEGTLGVEAPQAVQGS
jgi:hypothetical protein